MVMYGIYNTETIETFVNTLEAMHSKTTWNERLFWVKLLIGLISIYQKEWYIML